MSMRLYRFDSVEDFPVLESYTTVRGPVRTRIDGKGDEAFLLVTADLCADEPADSVVVIALPLLAVDGRPERLELALVCDQRGCAVFLDAMDATGTGLTYSFGTIDFTGAGTCSMDVQKPAERWRDQRLDESQPVGGTGQAAHPAEPRPSHREEETPIGVGQVDHLPQPPPLHHEDETQMVTPPIQFFRLGIRPASSMKAFRLGLVALTVTGDVSRAAPGFCGGC